MNTLEIERPADPLEAAALCFGNSQAALGRHIGYSASALSRWKRERFIPKRAKLLIEQATRGRVTVEDLRSVYPDRLS